MPKRHLEAVPLLDAEQPAQAQPQFPMTRWNCTQQGLVIQTHTSPIDVQVKILPPDSMDEIVQQWREFRKQQQGELETIQQVMRTKNVD